MFLMTAYMQFTHDGKMINNKYFFSFRLEIGTEKKWMEGIMTRRRMNEIVRFVLIYRFFLLKKGIVEI